MSSDESVLSPHAMDDEVKALQGRLREYEAALRSAAPRLAAFKRLEELARRQGSTPEAIASQAAFDVVKREKDAMVTMLQALATERDQLKGELAMLLINKTEASRAVTDIRVEHESLSDEVANLTDQISRIRAEAVRLMSERTELSNEVQALRAEVRSLHEACNPDEAPAEHHQRVGDPGHADDTVGADEVLVGEGDARSTNAASTNAASTEALSSEVADDEDGQPVPRRTTATSIDTDTDTERQESDAFDAFFHAEIDHDKSRDWILG